MRPAFWSASFFVGCGSTGMVNGGAFPIHRLPDVYRISADGTVLEKHCRY